MYAVILAGGGGTRLWPLSRPDRPKQFLPLLGPRSLLQQTVARLAPLVPVEDVHVVTKARYVDLVREQLPEIARERVLAEPVGRNTAAAVALAALAFDRGRNEVLAALPADHRVEEEAAFRSTLAGAAELAAERALVTLGIEPTSPETRFGYIVRRGASRRVAGRDTYLVERFVEKPDVARAMELIGTGAAYWNAGILLSRRDVLLEGLARYAGDVLAPLQDAIATGSDLTRVYPNVRATSIDYALLEPASADGDVYVAPADVGWSDLGSWSSLLEALAPDIRQRPGRVLQPGESAVVNADDLLVYREDGRLVLAEGDGGTIDCTTPTALLSGARTRTAEIEALLQRVASMERLA